MYISVLLFYYIKLYSVIRYTGAPDPAPHLAKDALDASGVRAAFLELDNLGPDTESQVQDPEYYY